MKEYSLIIGITILLGTVVFCECDSSIAVVPPHWEYDVTVTHNASIQLFVNESTYETVSDIKYDSNHNEISRTIHGVLADTIFSYDGVYVKNIGKVNLTDMAVFSNISHSNQYLIEVSFLEVNETIFIDIDTLNFTDQSSIEIQTEQGVYAKIYSITPESSGCCFFEFNGLSVSFILLAIISIFTGIFSGIRYKRNKKGSYLIILITTIILASVFLLVSYFSGITCLPA